MVTLYLLVHLPAAPYHYPFSKIGHYHKYFNKRLQKQGIDDVCNRLSEIQPEDERLKKYDEIVLLYSKYFCDLSQDVFSSEQNIIGKQVAWEYHLDYADIKQDNKTALLSDLPKNTNNAEIATVQNLFSVDKKFVTFPLKTFESLTLNHLQLDVLAQVEELEKKCDESVFLEKEMPWFLQAEHLQWMSHKRTDFLFASPFSSAYDAYINFMNMLSDLKTRL